MTITAKIVADSIGEHAPRLTTLQLRYPKFIHGEAKTHRQLRIADRAYELLQEVGFMDDPNLSRNASSSRAIPVARLIQDVLDDPAMPIHWGANQKGMQADRECDARVEIPIPTSITGDTHFLINHDAWLRARDNAVDMARAFDKAGYHKQIVNRLLEPFCHINVVVSATQWSNFFSLRCHPGAQPEMRALAEAIRDAMGASEPVRLEPGQWHLPYVRPEDRTELHILSNRGEKKDTDSIELSIARNYYRNRKVADLIKLSVARSARVSYLTQDGRTPYVAEDLALYDRLLSAVPLHASPAEHQATPAPWPPAWVDQGKGANFGPYWVQFRKTLAGECQ